MFARRGGAYVEGEVRDGAPAAALASAVVAVLKLDVAPDRVRLLREVEGGAPVPLDSCEKLAAQGVEEGSKVLVEVMAPATTPRALAASSLLPPLISLSSDPATSPLQQFRGTC